MTLTIRANLYPGLCTRCGRHVPPGHGHIERVDRHWQTFCLPVGACERKAAAAKPVNVGKLDGITRFFATAKVKYPHLTFEVPQGPTIRLKLAGAQSARPGSLVILDEARGDDGKRAYLGRVDLDGALTWSRDGLAFDTDVLQVALTRFSADPLSTIRQYGHSSGRCMICRHPLTTTASKAAGYGPDCAASWGLPWGTAAVPVGDFAVATVQRVRPKRDGTTPQDVTIGRTGTFTNGVRTSTV